MTTCPQENKTLASLASSSDWTEHAAVAAGKEDMECAVRCSQAADCLSEYHSIGYDDMMT